MGTRRESVVYGERNGALTAPGAPIGCGLSLPYCSGKKAGES